MKGLLMAVALAIGLAVAGCAAHTSLVPLGRGHINPTVGLGGPIVEAFDTHIAVPYLVAGADYGIADDVNASATVHLMPMVYRVAGVDLGAKWFPVMNDGWQPTLGFGPRVFLFASTRSGVDERFMVFPAASVSAAWKTRPGLIYAGADVAVPLSRSDYDDDASALIVSPFVGHRWTIGRRYALLTELKWHGANVVTDQAVTGYATVSGRGAVTPLIAFQWSY